MKRHFLFDAGSEREKAGGVPSGKAVENQLIGQVTAEQIDEWKRKHPLGVYGVAAGGHVGYFKMPGFDEINFSYSRFEAEKVLALWQAFAESTWLGGSEELLKNPTLFSGAKYVLQKKVDGIKAELLDL